MQAISMQTLMPEKDMAYTVLADLKRVVREYATAATESSCPQTRQMFTNLMNNTLRMQGNLFNAMQQQNMYSVASPALRQEVDKQIKEHQQVVQQAEQHLQQLGLRQQASFGAQYNQQQQQPSQGQYIQPQVPTHQQNQNQFYM
ncbi:spore coat protein [Paenibacillus oenotherae]|uniref:Spore coat protein n=1 Tax=Paenibacillus oenotherae TaxID=1435645 RepID=A0ABS7D3G8_9BACL|nr:spore coat protein [Paenibacillus oenotherae]MBW7474467.1 spore coat protein [Paenibacillus oenotherae]